MVLMAVLNFFFFLFFQKLSNCLLIKLAVVSLFNLYPKKDYINAADICLSCFLQNVRIFQARVARSMVSANSVKYHGNLYILIPLNQRLALTRLRETGPRSNERRELTFSLLRYLRSYFGINGFVFTYLGSHFRVYRVIPGYLGPDF